MEKQLIELESEIERLAILALGLGQWAKGIGENDTFGRMLAVSRFLRTALNKLREPIQQYVPPTAPATSDP